MPKGENDISVDHFDWVVKGRSQNQAATLQLYAFILENERVFDQNLLAQDAAQKITSVVFSLWRSVFLSDITGEFKDQLADIKGFLVSLISDNAILYITDKNARNWSFRYYLDNAIYRLREIADSEIAILPRAEVDKIAGNDKDAWIAAQAALDVALSGLQRVAATL